MNMRVKISHTNFRTPNRKTEIAPWLIADQWPCKWIGCRDAQTPPFVTAFRRRFFIENSCTIRIHVSADERYELYLDGSLIGRGSERGDKANWFFETYDLELKPGNHTLVARTWAFGPLKPWAQVSVHPGFILAPEEEPYISLLGTGTADWDALLMEGYGFDAASLTGTATGPRLDIDGARFPWGFQNGEGEGWKPAVNIADGIEAITYHIAENTHFLRPALLPPMLDKPVRGGCVKFVEKLPSLDTAERLIDPKCCLEDELRLWNGLLDGQSLDIPANSRFRAIIDLEDYYCIYPSITMSGGTGSTVRLLWAESLYYRRPQGGYFKGDRNAISGKVFRGEGDTFRTDGGSMRRFDTLWWRPGRYAELAVETGSEPLRIDSLELRETRYPFELSAAFTCSDPKLESIIPMSARVLQMCAHETYMDCPYYEQLMYVGDTRLQVLTAYAWSSEETLPRKALEMFHASRLNHTLLPNCSYPTNGGKTIPSFCLWWMAMVHDYALWRGNPGFISSIMPGVRNVLDIYLRDTNEQGLLKTPSGWNFVDEIVDASKQWKYGVPPDGGTGISSIFNLHMVHTLELAAELEGFMGEPELKQKWLRLAQLLMDKICEVFWDKEKGMFADDMQHNHFSEHAQCLALLCRCLDTGLIPPISKGLEKDASLTRTNIYYRHYLFEAFRRLDRVDLLLDRLKPWYELLDMGFKTTPEHFSDHTRSDCHAWGAHPLYHYLTTIIGIRPAAMGFTSVAIEPHLGPLEWAEGVMPHPKGNICVKLAKESDELHAEIELPEGLTGSLVYQGRTISLTSGKQKIVI